MIRRARIRFVAVTMSILFCVFFVIAGGVYYFLRNVNEQAIQRSLYDIEINYSEFGDDMNKNNFMVALITYTEGDPIIRKSLFDDNAFTNDDLIQIVKFSSEHASNFGAQGTIYYKISLSGENYLLVASDMSETMGVFHTNLVSAFITLVIIYLLLFLIVWGLSYSVLKPVKDVLISQKQFVSNVSHELKTPLTIISASTDILRQKDDNKWVSSIKLQTERMGDLVGDMLTLAKLEEDKPKLASLEFNLSEEIILSSLSFEALAFEKGQVINLNVEPNIKYKGDIQSVKKLLNILLDNAVKHAVSRGEINLTLKKENGKIIFTVFNTGSDIPAQDSNRIFERFYRGDRSRSRESGGSGLGLSIAKSIADVNKWKISATSRFGESMTIKVIF